MSHPPGASCEETAAAAPVIPEAFATSTGTWLGGTVVVVVVVEWTGGVVVDVDECVVPAVEPEAELVVVGWMTPSSRTVATTKRASTMAVRTGGSCPPGPFGGC